MQRSALLQTYVPEALRYYICATSRATFVVNGWMHLASAFDHDHLVTPLTCTSYRIFRMPIRTGVMTGYVLSGADVIFVSYERGYGVLIQVSCHLKTMHTMQHQHIPVPSPFGPCDDRMKGHTKTADGA